jgi:hypothetical protein
MGLLLFFFLAHQFGEQVDPFRDPCHGLGVGRQGGVLQRDASTE